MSAQLYWHYRRMKDPRANHKCLPGSIPYACQCMDPMYTLVTRLASLYTRRFCFKPELLSLKPDNLPEATSCRQE